MAGNVVGIHGMPTGQPDISDACVDTLRDLLQRAEAGDIIGIGISALHCDGCASFWVSGRAGGYSMIGALEMVKAQLVDINRGDL